MEMLGTLKILVDKDIDDKNRDYFIKALTKEGKKQGIEIVIDKIQKNEDVSRVYNEPIIIAEPYHKRKPLKYNNVDGYATAEVIRDICKQYNHCNILIINRSKLIGRPLVNMLLDQDHSVMIAHSQTMYEDLKNMVNIADIIISATGDDMFNSLHQEFPGKKIIIDVSNDFKTLKNYLKYYYSMSYIGKKTTEKIIQNTVDYYLNKKVN